MQPSVELKIKQQSNWAKHFIINNEIIIEFSIEYSMNNSKKLNNEKFCI